MRRIGISLFLFLLCSSAFAQSNYQHYIVGTRLAPRQVADDVLANDLPERPWRHRVTPFHAFRSVDAFEADMTWDEAQALKKRPDIAYVEMDQERHILTDSVTPGAETTPYGITMVDAPQVWPVTKGKSLGNGAPINVAIIDTGISYDDTELAAAYKGGFNELTGTTDPRDDNGHGTHVAGTIAAAMNSDGVVGVAPEVSLYSVKALDACGSGAVSKILNGIDWVIQKKLEVGGNWIMSLSLGSDSASTAEATAFQNAYNAGILTFAAAGNGYPDSVGLSYPAAYSTVVSVGAIDSTGTVASFSQRGADLKVVAPGVSVLSTFVDVSELDNVADSSGISVDAHKIAATDTVGNALNCASLTTATGNIVNCGSGNKSEFPSSVNGNIALIQRGGTSTVTGQTLTFAEKALNAKAAGAVAAIIYNNRATENPTDTPGWGVSGVSATTIPKTVVGVTQVDGQKLLTAAGASTVRYLMNNNTLGYALLNGTSMATPHAAGVGALVWAVAPGATNQQIMQALQTNAHDLGDAGRDDTYGAGLVDAYATAKALNPAAFGNGSQPTPQTPSGRRGLHRG
ncbi:MAG TPA: S8 family serine peptidase [Thermoanaerobaculia bacterium]|jgi:subtilisin family serine protease